jgi:hypothetical protein
MSSPCWLCVCISPRIATRQRLGEHEYTRNSRRTVGHGVVSYTQFAVKGKHAISSFQNFVYKIRFSEDGDICRSYPVPLDKLGNNKLFACFSLKLPTPLKTRTLILHC